MNNSWLKFDDIQGLNQHDYNDNSNNNNDTNNNNHNDINFKQHIQLTSVFLLML